MGTTSSFTPSFTPAAGRFAPTRLYDPVVALTRERLWRSIVGMYVAPRAGDTIVDIGCGTGSLAVLLARVQPGARIVGIDPDPDVLALAGAKAAAAGVRVDWRVGMGDDLPSCVPGDQIDTVVSSLVLHQCPLQMKRAVIDSMFSVLRPGGRVVIADFGRQRSRLMRTLFGVVQFLDGRDDTQPNADGVLPELMTSAGLCDVREAETIATVGGSISIYVASR